VNAKELAIRIVTSVGLRGRRVGGAQTF